MGLRSGEGLEKGQEQGTDRFDPHQGGDVIRGRGRWRSDRGRWAENIVSYWAKKEAIDAVGRRPTGADSAGRCCGVGEGPRRWRGGEVR